MTIATNNPATGVTLKTFPAWDDTQVAVTLQRVHDARVAWAAQPVRERVIHLQRAAVALRARREELAALMTLEMGKVRREAHTEIEKCAWGCEFFAEQAAQFLADETIASDAGRSVVTYAPLGTLLAVMPWNFPFWQVFRAAIPALAAGNAVVLKHASNVPQCALAIEEIFRACFPENLFRTLLISAQQAMQLIDHTGIQAVTITGSEAAGRQIAGRAGERIKKTVLELGGSDALVVLADADLDAAAQAAVTSRFLNCGQSCIAAKRIIPVEAIAGEFLRLLKQRIAQLRTGDPAQADTDLGPMARADLRATLHQQVTVSIERGAIPLLGCRLPSGPGYYYPASLLDRVQPGMPAYEEELFGPVAVVIRAQDTVDALRIANDNRYGLGGSVWTRDTVKGESFARALECGQAFVNGVVKSDPRLPFGGIKASGYGRELSRAGIREFVNIKTLWIQ